ncbi:MAG: hypothetical protein JXO22_03750, partial [Phycisphaerae bacterium]|nr:hypothetical protein [Phycisphaerae bacterium]
FQNWEKWMRLGWLDGACPMNYRRDHEPANYAAYRGWVHKALEWRYDRHVYGGQCLYANSMPNSITQLEYALGAGDDGTISFAYAATADNELDGTWEADWSWYPYVAANLFADPAVTPEMPWRGPGAVEGTLWGRITDGITGQPVDDATVTVTGMEQVQTDGNGYYVVTMIPAVGAGTDYAVGASHLGYSATNGLATVFAGDVARFDLAFAGPLPPEIAEVAPDPDETRVGYEYVHQLSLTQGTGQPWTLITGPAGATVTARGRVIGWVPTAEEDGQLVDFTVRAENSAGSDDESWQVLVTSPQPCEPMMLADFEGYPRGTHVMFQAPRYSGSTYDDLALQPNVSEVTDEVSALSGSNVYKIEWQYLDTDPMRWMRLTTSNAANIPNPTVRLDHLIRVRLRLDAGSLRLAVGVRETGTDADVGADGGTAGTIEWVGAASDIDGAPQGVLIEPLPGVWQTIIFDPLTDPIHGMTGDGTLTSYTNKAVIEHLAFTIVDSVGPFTVYIDDIELLCEPPPTLPDVIVESRDADGDVNPPPTYLEDGAWMNSTIKSEAEGLTGIGSRFINYEVPNSGTDNATFVPDVAVPGLYEVFVTWDNGANCYDARYTVSHYQGETVQLVDQIPSGAPEPANYDQWISLGHYWFDAGQEVAGGSVNVSEETVSGRPADGWGYRVYADALKLVFTRSWPDGDYTGDERVDVDDYAYWQGCMTSPGVEYGVSCCHAFDFDLDNDLDLIDFVEFQRVFANLP